MKSSWHRDCRLKSDKQTVELLCRGLLFDLDGTLLDSLHAVDRAWTTWSLRHGLDPVHVLSQIHGRRSVESIRALLPDADAEAEDLVIRQIEATDTLGVLALPGAIDFLNGLPSERWGIVTSGTSDVARARMAAAGLKAPSVCVFGEDVRNGKPHPEPYLMGAKLLGFSPDDIVAFEDTAAGLQSITSANMQAVAVGFPFEPAIYDYRQLQISFGGDDFRLIISPK